ncbi:glycosyltransferase [Actinomycetospora endophytica]|uniref:Glycosyltransferase n=1 Tax=Actinomycetospora endophytica TaxID=2291215 RepID=A0ABS8P7Y3_9PSEU|nr:glycosyltransferase [Actinomycetospora endophytica]MCD2193640.1 glycosyltransferase [Actinomycetospora endophytica]
MTGYAHPLPSARAAQLPGHGLLVHEWLAPAGGSEQVFDRIVADFPRADVLCLWDDRGNRYPDRQVRETWLARTPLRHHKALALPLTPLVWAHQMHGTYDWAVVSTHSFAHHVRFSCAPGMRKILYVHTPARYVWEPELDARGDGALARAASPWLRALDRRRAAEAHTLVANSHFVARRIARTWSREAHVIHPPVEVERIASVRDWRGRLDGPEAAVSDGLPSEFVLGASRFIPYKRLDLVIRAGEAVDLPVVIAGGGPEEEALRAAAAPARVPVHVVVDPSDALLYSLYQRATVFVFPPVEDFGIMPVEAMATGTPAVVNVEGGAPETLAGRPVGAVFDAASPASLREAVETACSRHRATVADHARRFDSRLFDDAMTSTVVEAVSAP